MYVIIVVSVVVVQQVLADVHGEVEVIDAGLVEEHVLDGDALQGCGEGYEEHGQLNGDVTYNSVHTIV